MLGDDLLGAYLHGSAVLGGSLPTSDLDLLAISARPTTVGERRGLIEALMVLSEPPPDRPPLEPERRPIELTIVVASDVRPWRFPPPVDFQYGDWHREAYERGEIPLESPNPDLAVLIELVRRAGVPVIGPRAAELLDPVPWLDVVRAMPRGLDGLLEDLDHDARNVILTLTRMWHTLETRQIVRKDVAAAWVAERLTGRERAVVEAARGLYLAGVYGPWDGLEAWIGPTAGLLAGDVRRIADAMLEAGPGASLPPVDR